MIHTNDPTTSSSTSLGPYTMIPSERNHGGSFGKIILGNHMRTGANVAMKLERVDAVTSGLLKHECKILYYLTNERGCENVPRVEWWSITELDGIAYRVLVIPLYDKTLAEAARERCGGGGVYQDDVIHHWVREMIRILYQVHEAGILHRDIKPQNFMLRSSSHGEIVYLIDFGLSTVYVDDEFRGHLPPKPDQEQILGTPKYVSLYVHDGKDASRRDDLISVGYVWLFLLLRGKLPWDQVVTVSTDVDIYPSHHIRHPDNVERRRQKDILSRVLPEQPLKRYLDAVYRLDYEERPPYTDLIDLIY